MKQQVDDISVTLIPLLERLDSMPKSMDEMSKTNVGLNRTNQVQTVTIAKLAPRKHKGIVSQGMILSAEDLEENLSLIQPSSKVDPGCQIG